MSLTPHDHQAVPLGLRIGTAANDYAEPSGRYLADILRRHVQFIDRVSWRDERAKVFDALITLSFGANRAVAWVPEQARLRRMTTLGDTVISRAVRALEVDLGMLTHERKKKDAGAHRDRRTGGMLYRIDPDPANWRVVWRIDAPQRKLAIDEWAWVYSVNLHPEAPSLPLPSDVPGLADALRELAREAALDHPLTSVYPPQSREAGRAPLDAATPDNKQRVCRHPLIGNEPSSGVREADAPGVGSPGDSPGHPSVDTTSGANSPTTSDPAALPAHLQATPENIRKAVDELRASLDKVPGQVSSPANLLLAKTGGTKLAGELTPLARASDVSEHLHPKHPGNKEIHLSSPKHPDVPDACSLHLAKPDALAGHTGPQPGDYTGDLVADLIRAMGAGPYAEYRGAWKSYMACDRRRVIEILGDYSIARKDPRRSSEVQNAGAWMGHVFRTTSWKWKEIRRAR